MTYVPYTEEKPPEGELVRSKRCSDCAFTHGTEANADPLTAITARACVESMSFFYCHRDATDTRYIEEPEALCAGWLHEVTKLLDKPNTPEEREAAMRSLREADEVVDLMQKALGPTGGRG